MELNKIQANNFLSFKELEYDFVNHPVLIQGENLTDDSQESNGSGKSAIQAAIEYCLFKNTSRKVIDNKLIHFGESDAYLSLSIYCPSRNQELLIERKLQTKGSNSSQVSVNGIVKYAFEDKMVNEIDKFIIDWIGIDKVDLQNYFIINKERFKSIFSSSNREKMELVNRFSNAQLISGVDKIVQREVAKIESEIDQKLYNKARVIGSIRTIFQEKKVELNRDIEAEIKDRLQGIETKVDYTNVKLFNLSKSLVEVKSKIKDITVEVGLNTSKSEKLEGIIERFKSINNQDSVKKLENELESTVVEINKHVEVKRKDEEEIRFLNKTLREIEVNLAGAITCPKCEHKFVLGNDIDIDEETQQLGEVKNFLKTYETKVKKSEQQIDFFNKKNKEVYDDLNKERSFGDRWDRRFNRLQKSIWQDSSRLERSLNVAVSEQEEIIRQTNKYQRALKDLEEEEKRVYEISIDQKRIDGYNDKLKALGGDLKDINVSIKELKSKSFDAGQWVVNFKKFNMFLANQSLKVLQGYCNKFLIDLKSDMQVKWEGFKMLASGKTKEEISSYILRDNEERDFWSFSGGERARLEYAMIFTVQEMINRTHPYGGLNFLSTDEIAEGMDAQGLSDLMRSLKGLNKAVLITTHVINKNVGENVLQVRKINGVSEIVK